MRILFICGSLEPGRNGVGDYTRHLACELIRQGHSAAAISLNDNFLNTPYYGNQELEKVQMPVLRMPSTKVSKKCIRQIKEWVDEFNPEWISLQYVPFSFHPKGLPFGLWSILMPLGEGRRWHFMFHELWVGTSTNCSLSHVLWGGLQRAISLSLLSKANPSPIHTNTRLYQAILEKHGCRAELLQLFSNIPVKGERQLQSGNDRNVSIVTFGRLHSEAPVEEFAEQAGSFARQKGVTLTLTIVGRSGPEKERWSSAWKKTGLEIELLGELPPAAISQILAKSTFGISTTPLSHIEKSGAVAAMREHGLPVLCLRRPQTTRGLKKFTPPSIPGVTVYDNIETIQECLKMDKGLLSGPGLTRISQEFIASLSEESTR